MEKPLFSIKQQLSPFKGVFGLLEEFKTIFDQELAYERQSEGPTLK